jgi:hypothetical protein
MIDEDFAFEVFAGQGIFKLNEQGFIRAIAILVVEETLK